MESGRPNSFVLRNGELKLRRQRSRPNELFAGGFVLLSLLGTSPLSASREHTVMLLLRDLTKA